MLPENSEEYKMNGDNTLPVNNEEYKGIIEDANKIVFVLPEVPLWTIISMLQKLPRENRIENFLKDYFKYNQINRRQTPFINDLDVIHNLLPAYSKVDIATDLSASQNTSNRVQSVVKQYINQQKEPLEEINILPSPVIRAEIDGNVQGNSSDIKTNNSPWGLNSTEKAPSILSALNDVLPNKNIIDLILICNRYGYKTQDKVSVNELNTLLEQIICENSPQNYTNEQPSTSLYEFKPGTSDQNQSQSSTVTESYDFNEDDFYPLTQSDNSQTYNSVKDNVVIKDELPDEQVMTSLANNDENKPLVKIEKYSQDTDTIDLTIEPPENKKRKTELIDLSLDTDSESSNDAFKILRDLALSGFDDDLKDFSRNTSTPFIHNEQEGANSLKVEQNELKKIETVFNQENTSAPFTHNTDLLTLTKDAVTLIEDKVQPMETFMDFVHINYKYKMAENQTTLDLTTGNRDLGEGSTSAFPVNSESLPREVVKYPDINEPGPSDSKRNTKDTLYYTILQMFPDICPQFLEDLLQTNSMKMSASNFGEVLVTHLLKTNYIKREKLNEMPDVQLDFDEEMAILEDLFPDADPTFLQSNCEQYVKRNDQERLRTFVNELLESRNYPTKTEYLKKLKLSAQEKKYTTEFSIEHFLEVIPDPIKYFEKTEKPQSHAFPIDTRDYKVLFFKNHFKKRTIKDITNVLSKNWDQLLKAAEILEKFPYEMKTQRKEVPLPSCDNIPLLQKLAFIKHKKEILDYLQKKEQAAKEARLLAKQSGLLKTCHCCFDDEVMPLEIITCDMGHEFCKTCVNRSAEVLIGEGKLNFPCLEQCNERFSLKVLQMVLKPNVFSRMAQKKQLEEIKAAGIEDLISCPFCDFATIPAPGDKLFRCLNEECMKESCLECKEPSHIPLRCNEVEKDQDIKIRTYIEDKMTEALVRTCYKCGFKFIKEGGCNKMTCSCGAMMCYLCNRPVNDYKHFNGNGGDKYELCPLYSDTITLHAESVKRGAELAKAELGVKTEELKKDPSIGIESHYREVRARQPQPNQNGRPLPYLYIANPNPH